MIDEVEVTCPYCWETIALEVDLTAGAQQTYTEDCSVCCNPMRVRAQASEDDPGQCSVEVEAENA